MLLTAAAIRQFCAARELSSADIQLRFTDNDDYQYACHMGFFQSAGFPQGNAPGEAPGSSTYIPLTKLNIRDMQREAYASGELLDRGDLIERKSDELARVLAQHNTELQKLCDTLSVRLSATYPNTQIQTRSGFADSIGTTAIWPRLLFWTRASAYMRV